MQTMDSKFAIICCSVNTNLLPQCPCSAHIRFTGPAVDRGQIILIQAWHSHRACTVPDVLLQSQDITTYLFFPFRLAGQRNEVVTQGHRVSEWQSWIPRLGCRAWVNTHRLHTLCLMSSLGSCPTTSDSVLCHPSWRPTLCKDAGAGVSLMLSGQVTQLEGMWTKYETQGRKGPGLGAGSLGLEGHRIPVFFASLWASGSPSTKWKGWRGDLEAAFSLKPYDSQPKGESTILLTVSKLHCGLEHWVHAGPPCDLHDSRAPDHTALGLCSLVALFMLDSISTFSLSTQELATPTLI